MLFPSASRFPNCCALSPERLRLIVLFPEKSPSASALPVKRLLPPERLAVMDAFCPMPVCTSPEMDEFAPLILSSTFPPLLASIATVEELPSLDEIELSPVIFARRDEPSPLTSIFPVICIFLSSAESLLIVKVEPLVSKILLSFSVLPSAWSDGEIFIIPSVLGVMVIFPPAP